MDWYNISISLSITYTLYILLSQYLNKNFDINARKICVNGLIISAILCIIIYPNDIITPTFDNKYLLLILIGFCLFFQNYLLQIGTESKHNMGMIEGLAVSLYLLLITFLLFQEKLNIKKKIGIVFVSIAAYLLLSSD